MPTIALTFKQQTYLIQILQTGLTLYAERLKTATEVLENMRPKYDDAPEAEISMKEISAEMLKAEQARVIVIRLQRENDGAIGTIQSEELFKQLCEARRALPNIEDIHTRLANIEFTNMKVRYNQGRETMENDVRSLQTEMKRLTELLKVIGAA